MNQEMQDKIEAAAVSFSSQFLIQREEHLSYGSFHKGATFICENYAVLDEALLDEVIKYLEYYLEDPEETCMSIPQRAFSKLKAARGE